MNNLSILFFMQRSSRIMRELLLGPDADYNTGKKICQEKFCGTEFTFTSPMKTNYNGQRNFRSG